MKKVIILLGIILCQAITPMENMSEDSDGESSPRTPRSVANYEQRKVLKYLQLTPEQRTQFDLPDLPQEGNPAALLQQLLAHVNPTGDGQMSVPPGLIYDAITALRAVADEPEDAGDRTLYNQLMRARVEYYLAKQSEKIARLLDPQNRNFASLVQAAQEHKDTIDWLEKQQLPGSYMVNFIPWSTVLDPLQATTTYQNFASNIIAAVHGLQEARQLHRSRPQAGMSNKKKKKKDRAEQPSLQGVMESIHGKLLRSLIGLIGAYEIFPAFRVHGKAREVLNNMDVLAETHGVTQPASLEVLRTRLAEFGNRKSMRIALAFPLIPDDDSDENLDLAAPPETPRHPEDDILNLMRTHKEVAPRKPVSRHASSATCLDPLPEGSNDPEQMYISVVHTSLSFIKRLLQWPLTKKTEHEAAENHFQQIEFWIKRAEEYLRHAAKYTQSATIEGLEEEVTQLAQQVNQRRIDYCNRLHTAQGAKLLRSAERLLEKEVDQRNTPDQLHRLLRIDRKIERARAALLQATSPYQGQAGIHLQGVNDLHKVLLHMLEANLAYVNFKQHIDEAKRLEDELPRLQKEAQELYDKINTELAPFRDEHSKAADALIKMEERKKADQARVIRNHYIALLQQLINAAKIVPTPQLYKRIISYEDDAKEAVQQVFEVDHSDGGHTWMVWGDSGIENDIKALDDILNKKKKKKEQQDENDQ